MGITGHRFCGFDAKRIWPGFERAPGRVIQKALLFTRRTQAILRALA